MHLDPTTIHSQPMIFVLVLVFSCLGVLINLVVARFQAATFFLGMTFMSVVAIGVEQLP